MQASKSIGDNDETDVDVEAHSGGCLACAALLRSIQPGCEPPPAPSNPNPVAEFTQIPSQPSTPELDLVKFELVSKLVVKQINPSFIIAPLHLFLSDQISV